MIKELKVRVGMMDFDISCINRELSKNNVADDDIISIIYRGGSTDIYQILYKSRDDKEDGM